MPAKQRSIFIAGPMKGRPDYNRRGFNEAEEFLRWKHPEAKIYNPARNFPGDTPSARTHLEANFDFLLNVADTVAFLEGWQGSEGALICHQVTRILQFDFMLLDDINGMEIIHSHEEWTEFAPVAYEAHRLVFGQRMEDYGHPTENLAQVATLWSGLLGVTVSPEKAAQALGLLKVARQRRTTTRDTLVDKIGYAILEDRIRGDY